MKIESKKNGDVVITKCTGKCTLSDGGAFMLSNEVIGQLASNEKKILLDLSELSYMDSTGLGELVKCYTKTGGKGGKLKLLSPVKKLMDLLTVTKLMTIFEIFDDEEKAIASFKQ